MRSCCVSAVAVLPTFGSYGTYRFQCRFYFFKKFENFPIVQKTLDRNFFIMLTRSRVCGDNLMQYFLILILLKRRDRMLRLGYKSYRASVFQPRCLGIALQLAWAIASLNLPKYDLLYANPDCENRVRTSEIILTVESSSMVSGSLFVTALKIPMARSDCKRSGEPILHQLSERDSISATVACGGIGPDNDLDLAVESFDHNDIQFPMALKLTINVPASWALTVNLKPPLAERRSGINCRTIRLMALGGISSGCERYLYAFLSCLQPISAVVSRCPCGDEMIAALWTRS